MATTTILVALVFAAAGVQKIRNPDPFGTMLGHYVDTKQGVTAVGCMEIGLALWLLSFRTPRLASSFAAIALVAFTLLIVFELSRNAPLPCGCLEATPGAENPQSIRQGLYVSIGRNVFLILCALVAAGLAESDKRPEAEN